MSKTHYISKEKSISIGDRIKYKTSCGLSIYYLYEKLKDDEVIFGSGIIDNTQDKNEVTCINCKRVLGDCR